MPSKSLRWTLPLLAVAAIFPPPAGAAGAAAAVDVPLRKPGLWEIRMQSAQLPGTEMTIQQCIDRNTDSLLQQRVANEKADCSAIDVRRDGERVTLHAVCRIEGTTATSDASYTGNFASGYQGEMRSRYEPPLYGISETRMTQVARWLGACKPGQKPGDVIMPDRGSLNINELLKDPRVSEALKRQARP